MLAIILLLVISYFVLQSSRVQSYLVGIITSEISKNLDANFKIEAVNFSFFNKLILKNVYVEDQFKDTLLFSEKLTVNIKAIDRKSKVVDIQRITLDRTKFYLYKDTTQSINIKFITDQFKSTDTSSVKPKWKVAIRNIEMHESFFRYRTNRIVNKPYGVNFNNMVCAIHTLDVRSLTVEKGTVEFFIKKLEFTERSGFNVYSFKSNMSIADDHMKFKNITIRTENSFIVSDSISFRQRSFDDYQNFNALIKLDFAFQESNVSFIDIGFFAPKLKNIPLNVGLSGYIYGRINSLKGKDVRFQVGKQTELITDFNFNGLPDINQTYIFADFKKFTTYANDFELINRFVKPGKKINFPENLKKLGKMSYEGNFTGFIDDFVTYGKFISALGKASTDISLKPVEGKKLAINGKLKTINFRIGELLSEKIGKISFDAQIDGKIGRDKTIAARTDGIIHTVEINNYNYQNIIIDGFLTEKKYDGFLKISDPNIILDFSGGIDFSKKVPAFNFSANVPKANLYGLNIDKKDSTSFLSFEMNANFVGNNIDNAIGEININNSRLVKFNENLTFNTLKIVSEQLSDTHRIELKSDYIDAVLYGKYKYKTLVHSIKSLFLHYLPALVNNPSDTLKVDFPNSFTADILLKNTNQLTKIFIPDITISDNSKIDFKFNANNNRFFLTANSLLLRYKTNTFNDLSVVTFSDDSLFTAITKSKRAVFGKSVTLEDFRTTSITRNNDINLKIDWKNNDTTLYQGRLIASTTIEKKDKNSPASFNVTILPSEIIVNDSLWRMNKAFVKIDTTSISINNFIINHKNQFFKIDGRISEINNDTLFIDFGNLNLAYINIFTKKIKLDFKGIINGNANFSNLYSAPLFSSNIIVNKFSLNKEEYGDMYILSTWDYVRKGINIKAFTQKDEQKNLNVDGEYYPNNKGLDFKVTLDKFRLNLLNSFLGSFSSDVKGTGSGSVTIKGTLDNPDFNGELDAQKATLTIDYLKTRYNFTDKVLIVKNSIVFNDITVLDQFKNKAITNGNVTFGPRKSIDFNFTIRPTNFHALNTTGKDNEMFYGTAFMTGVVNLRGNSGNINIDISGKTEKNTKLNIPISKSENIVESGFVTFINKGNIKQNIVTDDYQVDLSGFRLNFDLEVTPDAETQLIFDSKIGDVIRATGEGNLKLEIDKNSNFNMFGDYNIVEGDYLFTLQNIINKKFEIEQGGKILWNGDPYNANIDIEAIYNLRAPLSNLFPEDSSDFYRKRIPVECQIFMTQSLKNPDVVFNINLPTTDEDTKNRVRTIINTQEKLNKQFLSLLIINNFFYEEPDQTNFGLASYGSGSASTTTTELLSNQLSHWLSQISDEWDIGVNYRPGDEISTDQVEVALSTQILNDRVNINGNLGYGGQTEQASNIVGDFNVDVKLNKSGKLRLKAFNEANDKLIYEDSPYTQGVGIFYREEFNTFPELFHRFWNKLTGKKEEEIPLN